MILAVIAVLIAVILLIPIRIFVSYHYRPKAWAKILFLHFDIFPRQKKEAANDHALREDSPPSFNQDTQNEPPKQTSHLDNEKPKETPKEAPKEKPNKAAENTDPAPQDEDEETAEEGTIDKFIRYYERFSLFFDPFRRIIKRLFVIEELSVTVSVGTSDAADTAVYTGMLWGTAYNILGLIARFVTVKNHEIKIEPSYNAPTLSTQADCIIRTNAANIIGAAAIAAIAYLKYKYTKTKQGGNKNE